MRFRPWSPVTGNRVSAWLPSSGQPLPGRLASTEAKRVRNGAFGMREASDKPNRGWPSGHVEAITSGVPWAQPGTKDKRRWPPDASTFGLWPTDSSCRRQCHKCGHRKPTTSTLSAANRWFKPRPLDDSSHKRRRFRRPRSNGGKRKVLSDRTAARGGLPPQTARHMPVRPDGNCPECQP